LADTLSIATMELVDNAVMLVIPGAMNAGLVNTIFWLSMPLALAVAFLVAWPVNNYLLQKGKGHALVHEYHHAGAKRKSIPEIRTSLLVGMLGAFMLGGLVVSLAVGL
jgi:hypothetical protein